MIHQRRGNDVITCNYEAMTFCPTRLLPSSGECASGPERSSAARLVAKPIAEITTLPSAAAARVRRYTLTASGTPSLLRMGDAHLQPRGARGAWCVGDGYVAALVLEEMRCVCHRRSHCRHDGYTGGRTAVTQPLPSS